MRLFDELFKDAEGGAVSRCTVVPGGGGYFEGVKAVGDFSPEQIVVYFPKASVLAEGKGLVIKKYCDGDLQLSGEIYALRVVDERGTAKEQ